jgi:cytochrome P450
LVVDFDLHYDPALLADPHERVIDLVKNAPPVFWSPRNGGGWVLAGHKAVFDASRDPETFSSSMMSPEMIKKMIAALPPGTPHIPQPKPINLDPPEHGKYRAPLLKIFSPKAIEELKISIHELAASLIEEVKPKGGCEFMAAIGEPLPVKVFLKMLGLPLDRLPEYRTLVSEHLAAQSHATPAESVARLQKIAASMRDVTLARKEKPENDILSKLWTIEVEGKPTTLEDMENYGVLLFIAGLDTVMNGMGHAVRRLAWDLPLQRALRADPSLIKDASEEMLRRYTFTVPVRFITKDTEFEGVKMKKGDKANIFLPAADLDPKEYGDPTKYDIKREDVHIAFGAGPHRCLGSHLARVELVVLYEEMLKRLPEFRLDPNKAPSFHGGHVIGVDTLHLLW